MTTDEKMYTSILRTTEGALFEPEADPNRLVGVSPAYLVEEVDFARITVSYDTPGNLEHRGILNPCKISDHRRFFPIFPNKEWLTIQRRKNNHKRRMMKKRIRCDLTKDGPIKFWEEERRQEDTRHVPDSKSESAEIDKMKEEEEEVEGVCRDPSDPQSPLLKRSSEVGLTSASTSQSSSWEAVYEDDSDLQTTQEDESQGNFKDFLN